VFIWTECYTVCLDRLVCVAQFAETCDHVYASSKMMYSGGASAAGRQQRKSRSKASGAWSKSHHVGGRQVDQYVPCRCRAVATSASGSRRLRLSISVSEQVYLTMSRTCPQWNPIVDVERVCDRNAMEAAARLTVWSSRVKNCSYVSRTQVKASTATLYRTC
jgi:hypothetical protein